MFLIIRTTPDGRGLLVSRLRPPACFHPQGVNEFHEKQISVLMFPIAASHRHRKQRQGPCRRRQLWVRVRREGLFGLVGAAIWGRGGEVLAHFVGALPLLESLGANSQGAGTHRQEHNERAQQERHHWPEDAVQQDAGVMGTAPQHVVRPEITRRRRKNSESRIYNWCFITLHSLF